MPLRQSKVAIDILRDAGAPKSPGSAEQRFGGGDMDDVDRSSWPEGDELIPDTDLHSMKAGRLKVGQSGARSRPQGLDSQSRKR